MLINWFTVGAQAINFLILVWLLKRFLYKPILHAIDEREKGIAAQLADVEAKKAEAQKDRDDFQHKNEAFDQERAVLRKKPRTTPKPNETACSTWHARMPMPCVPSARRCCETNNAT